MPQAALYVDTHMLLGPSISYILEPKCYYQDGRMDRGKRSTKICVSLEPSNDMVWFMQWDEQVCCRQTCVAPLHLPHSVQSVILLMIIGLTGECNGNNVFLPKLWNDAQPSHPQLRGVRGLLCDLSLLWHGSLSWHVVSNGMKTGAINVQFTLEWMWQVKGGQQVFYESDSIFMHLYKHKSSIIHRTGTLNIFTHFGSKSHHCSQ